MCTLPNEAYSASVPATVLDHRLKQRWGHLFKVLNSKAREADVAGHPGLGQRLFHVAERFYPTKRRQLAPCQASSDYEAALDAYNQLGQVIRLITEATLDERLVTEVEQGVEDLFRRNKDRYA